MEHVTIIFGGLTESGQSETARAVRFELLQLGLSFSQPVRQVHAFRAREVQNVSRRDHEIEWLTAKLPVIPPCTSGS